MPRRGTGKCGHFGAFLGTHCGTAIPRSFIYSPIFCHRVSTSCVSDTEETTKSLPL